jgi:hypothetical protein
MSWSSLFPTWLGGTSGLTGAQAVSQIAPTLSGDPASAALETAQALQAPQYGNLGQVGGGTTVGAGGGDLTKALKDMGSGSKLGSGSSSDSGAGASKAGLLNVQSQAYSPRSASNLDNLVAILNKRRDEYSPLNLTGQPVQQKATTGLLGF